MSRVWGRRAALAVAMALCAVLLSAPPDSWPAAPVTISASQAPGRLTVHVSLSRTVVRMGQRIRVDYSWTDGNGKLVDTNHIGTMAIKVIRNVPCGSTGKSPQPSSGHGSWTYTAIPTFVGPLNPTARVFVGFNVRTGGCAPVEDRTAGQWITVQPAQ